MDKNKIIVLIAIFFTSILIFKIGGDLLVDRVAKQVIEEIRQKYSPSRYGPGIDPDKLDLSERKK